MNKLSVKVIRFLMVVYARLPLRFHYFVGDVLSWIVKNVMHYRSDVVWVNLSRSFPEKKYHEIKAIYDDFYRHLGEILAEALWFGGSSSERLFKSGIVTVKNPEELNRIYFSTPSMTILSTHCGNWELLGGLLAYRTSTGVSIGIKEKEISVAYKRMRGEVADRVFALNRVAPLKEAGTECEVESGNILRYSLKHKDERRVYIYPTDQYPYGAGSYPIGEFMSQPTLTMLASVGIACKLSHSVMYMRMKRMERGKYEMELIPICEDASQMKPEDVMRRYYDLLEEDIRETPANWLWSHKRWK